MANVNGDGVSDLGGADGEGFADLLIFNGGFGAVPVARRS